MHDLRGTYVHRGDAERLRRRVRRWIIAAGAVATAFVAGRRPVVLDARAETAGAASYFSSARVATVGDRLRAADTARVAAQRLQRWNRIYTFSRRW
ncbi:MAG TPA: hypothetical protein VE861_09800, partial [Gemmatimonadaceae bacterium]|nr:hypothetical protein [Gemmatimonadaceae bacterium]